MGLGSGGRSECRGGSWSEGEALSKVLRRGNFEKKQTYLHRRGSLMIPSDTCRFNVSGHIYNEKAAGLTPSSASHCFMTSGAITPVQTSCGMKRDDVAGSTRRARYTPQDVSRESQLAGEPTTCMAGVRVNVDETICGAGNVQRRRSCRGRAGSLSGCGGDIRTAHMGKCCERGHTPDDRLFNMSIFNIDTRHADR